MKKILSLFFLTFVFFNFPLFAMTGLWEDGEFLNLSNVCIVSEKGETNLTPGGRQRPGTSIDEIINTYITPNKDRLSKVRIIDLSLNNMSTSVLDKFVSVLEKHGLWDMFSSVQLVLLSHNNIDRNVAPTLKRFLELNKERGQPVTFPYIYIVQTPIDNKNVRSLSECLKNPDKRLNEVPSLIPHLVFLKKQYVWHALNRVQVYHDMVKSHDLPKEWADIHNAYYSSRVLVDFERFHKNLKGAFLHNFVRISLEDPARSSKDNLSKDEVETLAKLVGNLSITSSLTQE